MTKTELTKWNKKVTEYAIQAIETHGREKAGEMVWRKFGAPAGMGRGKLLIKFGKEIVEL